MRFQCIIEKKSFTRSLPPTPYPHKTLMPAVSEFCADMGWGACGSTLIDLNLLTELVQEQTTRLTIDQKKIRRMR